MIEIETLLTHLAIVLAVFTPHSVLPTTSLVFIFMERFSGTLVTEADDMSTSTSWRWTRNLDWKFGGCYQSSIFRCGVFIPGRKIRPSWGKILCLSKHRVWIVPRKIQGHQEVQEKLRWSGTLVLRMMYDPYWTQTLLREPCGRASTSTLTSTGPRTASTR